MSNDFRSARFWAQELIENSLYDGAVAVDATMGNGYDTLWLAQRVGSGRVYAFDIQPQALARTEERLREAGLLDRAVLIRAGHEDMAEHVPPGVDAVLFNLGWLPGAPHGVTTRVETTLRAAEAALSLLRPQGILTFCVYPGHEEGARELEALLSWGKALPPAPWDVLLKTYLNQPGHPPAMLAVRRKPRRGDPLP